MNALRKVYWTLFCLTLLICGCGRRETLVEIATRENQLRINNEGEPATIDPAVATGTIEHNIMLSLYEGLVYPDSKDLSIRPGAAESWDISPDALTYTFHLRKNGRWSDGRPVTAQDFVESYHRMLMPTMASQYAYMLYPMKNAEAYNNGKITNFDQVGVKSLGSLTLQITLHDPTPYLLSMMIHDSWFPVPVDVVKKHGAIDDRNNRWIEPGHFVGNGPFVLKEWKMNSHILVEKNPDYWGATNVHLTTIYFDATDSTDTTERMFRSGQLHSDPQAPPSKVAFYRKYKPDLIKVYPLLATYFYKINVTRPPLNDKRVRRALAMAIDRNAICETIMRAGQAPAYCLTPPDTAGYNCQTQIKEDVAAARKLLADAGYPDGKGFPRIEILFNTLQEHKAIAEAFQAMWKKNLNIDVDLHNEEWKVYLDSMRHRDYYIGRFGWNGDYVDPSTFLDIFTTDGGNNETGWSNKDYDHWVKVGGNSADKKVRYDAYQKAEAILMDEMPIIPIYFYTRPRLIRPSMCGWHPNVLDQYDFRTIYLAPEKTER